MAKVDVFQIDKMSFMVQIQPLPKDILSQVKVSFFNLYKVYYKATAFLLDTLTYFNYFSIRDSVSIQRLFIKKGKGIYLLYTRISRNSQFNFLTANARFSRNIGTLF